MKIIRERYLDDTKRWHLSIELITRTADMHSAIDALGSEDRRALADVLVEALEKVARILAPAVPRHSSRSASAG